ncbi:hypothetical protein [Actinocrispum wychmicini]|uniref:hypothetical protein n=1 Tax=Actinocrispum wychmicini TaxID=1213861 RepID=UPI0010475DA9|nr:hypothetical protein [Actinocrispum wychmicini]
MNIWIDPPPDARAPLPVWLHWAAFVGIVLAGLLLAAATLVGISQDQQQPYRRAEPTVVTVAGAES